MAALEKSSKKECAMCHVMWLDVFRSEQETLIEWQPGNVLMKDTQGIVSAEAVCYSCHDGYVLDDRHTAWKGNNHPTFEKLPEDVQIPEPFTLSSKGEIYCGTCHTPHAGREAEADEALEESIPGPMSFLRISNRNSAMCEKCHVSQTDYKRTNGHPVHTDKLDIPETLFEIGSIRAEKEDTVICQTCHRVHGAKGDNLTVMGNRQSELCTACHQQRSIIETQHDLRLTMPQKTNIRGQTPAESGPCGACHVPHSASGYRLWARQALKGNPASEACLSCHGNNAGDKAPQDIKGIGRYSHPNDIPAVSEDDPGRARANPSDTLPYYGKDGKPLPSGRLQCFTCHSIHQWDPENPASRGGKDVEGTAANSFLRMPASQSSALCVECHNHQGQLLAFDHNLVRTAPEATNIQGVPAAVSGPCGACHIPHNAGDKRLWARDLKPAGELPLPYCTGCHSENGSATEKQVGKNDHPVNVASEGQDMPPAEKVGRLLPLFDKTDGLRGGRHIMCRTCHDPHAWAPANGDSQVPDLATSLRGNEQNIEGDARNSFLRRPASTNPDLCIVCHEDTALLVGTDHDLFVTAPDAKNRMDQTVAESGQCGTCHAVHNSPETFLLWARSYGPVAEDQHPMNRLCTSCHSEGGISEEKVPAVATHPAGQLITNIMRSDNQSTGHLKLFDDDGKEVNVGDLSCSSCHSFYQWSYRVNAPGPGENVEGNANTSFLRASSENVACIDCHGQTAIWRYTYFHSLEKRDLLKGRKP